MATSFEVIFLGTLPLIDTTQGNETMESAGAILGTYGTTGSPLSTQIRNLAPVRLTEDDNNSYDVDNGGGYDSFSINGGTAQNFDGWSTYNALVTYSDGSTATITAAIIQDVSGNTYLVPEQTNNTNQAALVNRPIMSLTLQSVVATTGDLVADRVAGDFKAAVDGTVVNDSMGVGYTDAQGDQITNGNDDILSGTGNDTINAGGGNDFILAGGGNDSVEGGDGNDRVLGEAGTDTLSGGIGNDTLFGGDSDDTLIGGAGADVLDGGTGRDTADYSASDAGVTVSLLSGTGLGGHAQGDSLNGVDNVIGSSHGDVLTLNNFAGAAFGGGGADTLFGGTGNNDSLFGGDGNDQLSGLAGNDSLDGGANDDVLIAGLGNDTLIGGTGNDTVVFVGPVTDYSFAFATGALIVTDSVPGRDGVDRLEGVEFATFNGVTYRVITGDDGSNTTLQGPNDGTPSLIIAHAGNDWGGGHATSDAVFGGAGNDTLDGGDGNDTLVGEADDDLLRGDGGNDSLFGGTGNDTLQGGAGSDALTGGDGDELLQGGEGNDTLIGGIGNDTAVFTGPVTDYSFGFATGAVIVTDGVAGRDGVDRLEGVEFATFNGVTYRVITGDDGSNTTLQGPNDGTPSLIIAHAGNDWGGGHATSDAVFGGAGNDTLDGGDGNDTLVGEADDDLLRGDGGDDSLIGGVGNDTLQGGAGNDILNAGSGNDLLQGDLGNDTLTTGDGVDTIILTVDGGADRITDFNMTRVDGRTIDQIDVSELTNANGDPIRWRDVTVTDTNGNGTGDAVLTFANGESIVLEGVSLAEAQGRQNLIAIGIPCFTTGTPIRTPTGWTPVESLRAGDLVLTSQGAQRVLWSGHRALSEADLAQHPERKPIHFPVHAIGNSVPLRLSPQHAVLMRDLFGAQVLVRAKHLAEIGFGGARVAQGVRGVRYHHVLLERHAVLCAAGAAVESFYPGALAMEMLDWPARLAVAAAIGIRGTATLPLLADELARHYGDRVHPLVPWHALPGLTSLGFDEASAYGAAAISSVTHA
jgi:Ca2+-binding RTX toxin-like protein